jgi:hypothetical protein
LPGVGTQEILLLGRTRPGGVFGGNAPDTGGMPGRMRPLRLGINQLQSGTTTQPRSLSAVISLALALVLGPPPAPVLADIGPEPTMEAFAALAEPALNAHVRKGGAVTYKWPYKLVAGAAGYYTCGLASSGRKGAKDVWVSAVVAHGQAVNVQWSTVNGMLAWDCQRHVRDGSLAPR